MKIRILYCTNMTSYIISLKSFESGNGHCLTICCCSEGKLCFRICSQLQRLSTASGSNVKFEIQNEKYEIKVGNMKIKVRNMKLQGRNMKWSNIKNMRKKMRTIKFKMRNMKYKIRQTKIKFQNMHKNWTFNKDVLLVMVLYTHLYLPTAFGKLEKNYKWDVLLNKNVTFTTEIVFVVLLIKSGIFTTDYGLLMKSGRSLGAKGKGKGGRGLESRWLIG